MGVLHHNDVVFGLALDPELTHKSIYKVTRELKKEQNSLYNCLNSIARDACFVSEIRCLYPSLPVLANLRCGLWYTSQTHHSTCYFKSTDGHNGNWSFSAVRLNWNVCELAAASGGVLIIDATRKGKRFPDAMTKTVPIWAAVINRAVARVRAAGVPRPPPLRSSPALEGFSRVSSLNAWLPDGLDLDLTFPTPPATPPAAPAAGAPAVAEAEVGGTGRAQQADLPLGNHAAPSCSLPGLGSPATSSRPCSSSALHDPAAACCAAANARAASCRNPQQQAEQLVHQHSCADGGATAAAAAIIHTDLESEPSLGGLAVEVQPSVDFSQAAGPEACPEPGWELGAISAGLAGARGAAADLDCPTTPRGAAVGGNVAAQTCTTADDVGGGGGGGDLEPGRDGPHAAPCAPRLSCCPAAPHERSAGLASGDCHSSSCSTYCREACSASTSNGTHSRTSSSDSNCSLTSSRSASPSSTPAWDCRLHLPLWISHNERLQIEQRLEGWVDLLLSVGADVAGLARVLTKPLRPLWISQSSRIWVDQVAQPDQLDFTPLVLVSASEPQPYQRMACTAAAAAPDEDQPCTGGPTRATDHVQQQQQQQQQQQRQLDWTYVYVPGAGDDEESWAAGLSPELFWQHREELQHAGPDHVHAVVKELLVHQREQMATLIPEPYGSSSPTANCHACASTSGGNSGAAAGSASGAQRGRPTDYQASTDEHHLLPAGCARPTGQAQLAHRGNGIYLLEGTGLALGGFEAGASPDVWRHVDAVLNCGAQQHPSMASENAGSTPQPAPQQQPQQRDSDGGIRPCYMWLPVQHYKYDRTSLLEHLDHALRFLSYHLSHGRTVLVHDANGLDACVCVAVAALLACYGPCSPGQPQLLQQYDGTAAPPEPVSKDSVRQRLAFVSSCFPQGRPTRGMLKQVFNFFAGERGSTTEQ